MFPTRPPLAAYSKSQTAASRKSDKNRKEKCFPQRNGSRKRGLTKILYLTVRRDTAFLIGRRDAEKNKTETLDRNSFCLSHVYCQVDSFLSPAFHCVPRGREKKSVLELESSSSRESLNSRDTERARELKRGSLMLCVESGCSPARRSCRFLFLKNKHHASSAKKAVSTCRGIEGRRAFAFSHRGAWLRSRPKADGAC